MKLLKSAWSGEARLWKVFWVLGIALPVFVGILAAIFIFTIILAPVAIALWVALFVYTICWWRMMWKCSSNVNWKPWSYIAKAVVVLSVLFTVKNIYDLAMGGSAIMQMFSEVEQPKEPVSVREETGEVMIVRPEIEPGDDISELEFDDVPVSVSNQLPDMLQEAPAAAPAPAAGEAQLHMTQTAASLAPEEKCRDKFAAEYRAAGYDPSQYPDKEAEYVTMCVDYLKKANQ